MLPSPRAVQCWGNWIRCIKTYPWCCAELQALDRFLAGAKLVVERALGDVSEEEETIVGMLQRVLHPRLKSQLSESNLAVRQVRVAGPLRPP